MVCASSGAGGQPGGGVIKENVPSLTGLRFIAALTVVVSHIFAMMVKVPGSGSILHTLLSVVGSLSGAGMTLFFVLSGFVIHMNYGHAMSTPTGLWNFFAARFARLYPLYLFFLCLDLSMKLGYHQFKLERLEALPYYLTLTQTWLYKTIDGNALVYQYGLVPAVSWSISTEWFFYLCFPVICLAMALLRTPRALLIAIAAFCVAAFALVTFVNLRAPQIAAYGVTQFGPIAGESQDGIYRWLAYFSPYVRVLEFALGCLASALLRVLPPSNERENRFGFWLMTGAILGAAGLQYVMFGRTSTSALIVALHMNFGFAPFLAVIIFGCIRYNNVIVRVLSARPIVLAGEASYSIYLCHMVVINAFRYEVPAVTDHQIWAAVLPQISITLAAIIGLSLVLWFLIEMPARRIVRRWLTISPRVRPDLQVATTG